MSGFIQLAHVGFHEDIGKNAHGILHIYRPYVAELCDNLRCCLTRINNNEFPLGGYASVHAIMDQLLMSQAPVMKSVRCCHANHAVNNDKQFSNSCKIMTVESSAWTGFTIQEYMDDFSVLQSDICPKCGDELIHSFLFTCHPPLLCIELWHGPHLLEPVLHINADSIH